MDTSGSRVLRGGSWNNNDEINMRSSYRNNNDPGNRNDNNGFRVVVFARKTGGDLPEPPGQPGLAARAKKTRDLQTNPPGLAPEKTESSRSWQPAAAGDKTRRPPVAPPRAGSRVFIPRRLRQAFQPSAGHAPDLVDLAIDEEKLALADPLPPGHDAPEDAESFEFVEST